MDSNHPSPRIAVVGAGLAGITLAHRLLRAGLHISIFDKNPTPGGRVGALSCISLGNRPFDKQVNAWIEQGLMAHWAPRTGVLEQGRFHMDTDSDTSVVTATMEAAGPFVSMGMSMGIQSRSRVATLMRGGGKWHLLTTEHQHEGPFDLVVAAIPAPQAAALFEAAPQVAKQLANVQMDPRWVLDLVVDPSLALPFDIARVSNSALDYVVCNSHRPGIKTSDTQETWRAFATTEWSVVQQQRTKVEAVPLLTEAFERATGCSVPEPLHVEATRWDFAHTQAPLGQPFLFDAEDNIACIGDWCLGHELADAWDSAHACADHLLAHFPTHA